MELTTSLEQMREMQIKQQQQQQIIQQQQQQEEIRRQALLTEINYLSNVRPKILDVRDESKVRDYLEKKGYSPKEVEFIMNYYERGGRVYGASRTEMAQIQTYGTLRESLPKEDVEQIIKTRTITPEQARKLSPEIRQAIGLKEEEVRPSPSYKEYYNRLYERYLSYGYSPREAAEKAIDITRMKAGSEGWKLSTDLTGISPKVETWAISPEQFAFEKISYEPTPIAAYQRYVEKPSWKGAWGVIKEMWKPSFLGYLTGEGYVSLAKAVGIKEEIPTPKFYKDWQISKSEKITPIANIRTFSQALGSASPYIVASLLFPSSILEPMFGTIGTIGLATSLKTAKEQYEAYKEFSKQKPSSLGLTEEQMKELKDAMLKNMIISSGVNIGTNTLLITYGIRGDLKSEQVLRQTGLTREELQKLESLKQARNFNREYERLYNKAIINIDRYTPKLEDKLAKIGAMRENYNPKLSAQLVSNVAEYYNVLSGTKAQFPSYSPKEKIMVFPTTAREIYEWLPLEVQKAELSKLAFAPKFFEALGEPKMAYGFSTIKPMETIDIFSSKTLGAGYTEYGLKSLRDINKIYEAIVKEKAWRFTRGSKIVLGGTQVYSPVQQELFGTSPGLKIKTLTFGEQMRTPKAQVGMFITIPQSPISGMWQTGKPHLGFELIKDNKAYINVFEKTWIRDSKPFMYDGFLIQKSGERFRKIFEAEAPIKIVGKKKGWLIYKADWTGSPTKGKLLTPEEFLTIAPKELGTTQVFPKMGQEIIFQKWVKAPPKYEWEFRKFDNLALSSAKIKVPYLTKAYDVWGMERLKKINFVEKLFRLRGGTGTSTGKTYPSTELKAFSQEIKLTSPQALQRQFLSKSFWEFQVPQHFDLSLKMPSVSVSLTKPLIVQSLFAGISQMPQKKIIQFPKQKEIQIQKEIPKQKEIQKQGQVQRAITTQQLESLEEVVSISPTTPSTLLPRFRQPQRALTPTEILPDFKKRQIIPRRKIMIRKRGFVPFGRRRKKFYPLSSPTTFERAVSIGTEFARKTLGASFRISSPEGFVQLKPFAEFRRAKKEPFTLVQMQRKRLVTPSERFEIIKSRKGGGFRIF